SGVNPANTYSAHQTEPGGCAVATGNCAGFRRGAPAHTAKARLVFPPHRSRITLAQAIAGKHVTSIETLFSMTGKIAVVTGAGTGMGKQFAHTLALAGARVACVARNGSRLEQVVTAIGDAGGEAIAIVGDVGDKQAIEAVFDEVETRFGRANVLVHCAAQTDFGLFPNIEDDTWDNLVKVNLSGTLRLCRSFSRRLIAANEPGTIV